MTEKKTLTFKEKLMAVQVELKAPKNLYNSFGNYKYRNAEGIQEALKPLLNNYRLYLTLTDSIEAVGDRIYVKASAKIIDLDSDYYETVSAYAREANTKKGMDDAQITGATSSYARKYALNGLFLLDDTKDVDTEEYQRQANVERNKTISKKQTASDSEKEPDYRSMLREFIKTKGLDPAAIAQTCGLTKDSTNEDFAMALDYAKDLVNAS